MKRVDTNEHRSDFNSSRRFHATFERLLAAVESQYILVSFSNEGYISYPDMLDLLSSKGYVQDIAVDFKRYVGAQIGIHSPSGERVGQVSHLRNTEHLFLVGEEDSVRSALAAHDDQPEQLPLSIG
jgi:adenine-specific DNA-methyltransferase